MTPSLGLSGDSCAPSPATTSTFPIVVVILKKESIIVVFLVVMLVGGDSIVDFGNRAHSDKGIKEVGGELVVGVDSLEHFPLEQQTS